MDLPCQGASGGSAVSACDIPDSGDRNTCQGYRKTLYRGLTRHFIGVPQHGSMGFAMML